MTQDLQVGNSCDSPIDGDCGDDGCYCCGVAVGDELAAAAAAVALVVAEDGGGCPCCCYGGGGVAVAAAAAAAVVGGDGWAERGAL